MIKKILLVLVIGIAAFLIFAATRPDDFTVTRSLKMAATPEVIFPHVNELKQWEAWSPYAKKDPGMAATYAGPPSGVGASHAWAGNNDVGKGSMTITESRPSDLVGIRLDFVEPFAGTNHVDFTFKPEGTGTTVSWIMNGKNSFMAKAMGLVMNMDKMIGDDFDKGLSNLKAIVETVPKP